MHFADVVLQRVLIDWATECTWDEGAEQFVRIFLRRGTHGFERVIEPLVDVGALAPVLRLAALRFRFGSGFGHQLGIAKQRAIRLRRERIDRAFDFEPFDEKTGAGVLLDGFLRRADVPVELELQHEGLAGFEIDLRFDHARRSGREIDDITHHRRFATAIDGAIRDRHRHIGRADGCCGHAHLVAARALHARRAHEAVARQFAVNDERVTLQHATARERLLEVRALLRDLAAGAALFDRQMRMHGNHRAHGFLRRLLIQQQMRRGEVEHGADIIKAARAVVRGQQVLQLHPRADELAHGVFVFGAVQTPNRHAALRALLIERGGMQRLAQDFQRFVP